MDRDQGLSKDLEQLKREFDLSFSEPVHLESRNHEDYIGFSLEQDLYALAVKDLKHLSRGERIVPFHLRTGHCLGLCGIQGKLIPIFDLSELTGAPVQDIDSLRWIAICEATNTFGLAFKELNGYIRISPTAFFSPPNAVINPSLIRGAFRHESKVYSVLNLDAVFKEITKEEKK